MNESFVDLYMKLISGEITPEEAEDVMNSSAARSLILYHLNKDKVNPLLPYDVSEITAIVNIAQFIYNNGGGSTGLSDSEFDTLYSIMIDNNGGEDIVSAPILESGNKIESHKYVNMRGTLTKIYYLTMDEERKNPSRRYLDEWKSTMENKIFNSTGKRVNLDNYEVYVFPKFDGVSGIFEMDENGNLIKTLTRGFTKTNEAENITMHFKTFAKRKYNEFGKRPYGLKTEIMMMESDFDWYNKTYNTNYKSTRSIVSAIINSGEYDPQASRLLHVIPLRVGLENGEEEVASEAFKDYPYLRCMLKDREVIRNFALKHRYVNDGLRTDGAVIRIIDPEIQKILGRENDKNLYEVAYKFTEESEMTEVLDIKYEVGLFGRITPVAVCKPVKLKGNTVDSPSLGSYGRFKQLKLRKGDKVKILYDIIPYLDFDNDCEHRGGKLFEFPTECPECGEPLNIKDGEALAICKNPDCPCRIKGKILNYLNNMRISGISYGVLDKLYENGIVSSILDIYDIKDNVSKIVDISGFGSKKVKSWIEEIESHMDVMDYTLLGSIGISGVGEITFKKIMELFTIDELMEMVENKDLTPVWTNIKGISEDSAMKIMKGLYENKKLISKLDKVLVIHSYKNSKKALFSACFSDIRDSKLEDWIIENGGDVVKSVTKKTSILIVPENHRETSKVISAKNNNVPIVLIDDAKEYIKTKIIKSKLE